MIIITSYLITLDIPDKRSAWMSGEDVNMLLKRCSHYSQARLQDFKNINGKQQLIKSLFMTALDIASEEKFRIAPPRTPPS